MLNPDLGNRTGDTTPPRKLKTPVDTSRQFGSLGKIGTTLTTCPTHVLSPIPRPALAGGRLNTLRNAVSVPEQTSPRLSLSLFSLLEQAELWGNAGQTTRARNLYQQAISQDHTGFARLRFGEFLYRMGWHDEALAELTQTLETARRQQNPSRRAGACRHLANLHRERGETALAASYRQQEIAARLECQAGDPAESAPPADFLSLANEALSRGDLDDAEQFAEHAVKWAQSQNCNGDLADAWGTWGEIQSLRSRTQAAWRGWRNAYFFHCRARDERGCAADLLNLARIARQNGWWTIAQRLLVKTQKILRPLDETGLQRKAQHFLEETNRVLAVLDRIPEWN